MIMLPAKKIEKYNQILRHELIPAAGCTEPIAVAYAFAVAKKYLKTNPFKFLVKCSENFLKNAKSVTIPQTNGLKGIETAAVLGAVGGDPDVELEVLHNVSESSRKLTEALINLNRCDVQLLEDAKDNIHFIATVYNEMHTVTVEVIYEHTFISRIIKDDEVIYENSKLSEYTHGSDLFNIYSLLNFDDILLFTKTADISSLTNIISRQIDFNINISNEGLKHQYGSSIGKHLLLSGSDFATRAKARAAAGSDARMSGCEMPVVINSGSGNQGLTVSLPVIEMAKEHDSSPEQLHRALILSNLVAIYQKEKIGRLSAYCGVVSAAAGASAGMCYLANGDDNQIKSAVSNTLSITSGIFCDGAKPSCAAKISVSVDAAIMGMKMAMSGTNFKKGDGLVQEDVDKTINVIGYLGNVAMKEVDHSILKAMLTPDSLLKDWERSPKGSYKIH
jgi:L-cysteine desulfidase